MLGLLIVGSLKRGLFFLGVEAMDQNIIIGAVLIVAVFAHQVVAPAARNWLAREPHPKEGST
jgi:ABC-type xylose transport system permease subunit